MRTGRCLEVLAETRARVDVPLIPMTYASIFDAYGWERLEADARAAGATSFIVPDLPADVHPELQRVQLVAPTSTDERLRLAADATDGWLYLVTVTGTTGARADLAPRSLRSPPGHAPSRRCRCTRASASRPRRSARGRRADGRHRRRLARGRGRRAGAGRARTVRRLVARRTRRVTRAARAAAATSRCASRYTSGNEQRHRRRRGRLRRRDRARARAARLGRDARRAVHAGQRALGLGRRHAAARVPRTAMPSGTRALARRARTHLARAGGGDGHAHLGAGRRRVVRATARTGSSRRAARRSSGSACRTSGSTPTRRATSTPRSTATTSQAVLLEPEAGVLHARRATQLLVEDGERPACCSRRGARARRTIRPAPTSSSGPAAPWLPRSSPASSS